MSEEVKPLAWLKFRVELVGPIVMIVMAAFTAYGVYVTNTDRADQMARSFAELKADVRSISAILSSIPGDQVRLQQMEQRQRDTSIAVGGLDARMNLVERKTDVTAATVEGIKGASGVHLRP